MIIDPTGEMPKVKGSRMETVAIGPMPGSTPISVPIRQPIRQRPRLAAVKATEKPSARSVSMKVRCALEPEAEHRDGRHRHFEHET